MFVVAVALSACTPSVKVVELVETPSPELAAIDSLMWQRPDSALAVLLDFAASPKADSLDVFDGHYTQLLASELLYKNDYQQSNRAELRQAVAYFDSLVMDGAGIRGMSLPFLTARTHYINGVGFYERDSVVEACGEYLKALETMEEHFQDKDLVERKDQFMVYTYNRLMELFSAQYMMESAIVCGEKALIYCQKEPSLSCEIPNIYFHIGKQYDKKGDKDKAKLFYTQAIEWMQNSNNAFFRDIASALALCNYQIGLDPVNSLYTLKKIVGQTTDEKERMTRFLTIGAIFFEEGIYDSALYYLKPVYENQNDTLTKILVADYLRIIYGNLGDQEKSNECMRLLANHKKSEGENKALVSKLEDMFNLHMNLKQVKVAEESRKKSVKKTIEIIVPFAVIVALSIFFLVRDKGKKMLMKQQTEAERKIVEKDRAHEEEVKRMRLEANKTLEDKEKQIEKEKRARQREKEKLQLGLQQREAQVNALEKALQQQREEAERRREAFLKEVVCCKINDNIRSMYITAREGSKQNAMLNEQDSTALHEAVLSHYPNFESVLLSKNPKMSKCDMQLCQLYLLGLDERQIAVLQCKSYSAIKKRAITLKNLLGIEENLQTYLLKPSTFQ